jgi:hypothetical protein
MVQVCLLNDPAKNKITWVPELLTCKIDQDQRETLAEILAENGDALVALLHMASCEFEWPCNSIMGV